MLTEIAQNTNSQYEALDLLNIISKDPVDLSNLTVEKKHILNELFKEIPRKIEKGELNEEVFAKLFSNINKILGIKIIVDLELYLIIISTAMINSTIMVLSGYNKELVEKTFKKVVLDIME